MKRARPSASGGATTSSDGGPWTSPLEHEGVPASLGRGYASCPTGWKSEYVGFLMSNHYGQTKSQFLCVDQAPETAGALNDDNGNLWYSVEAVCGSLPCTTTSAIAGPYVQNREIHCVVCSK